MAVNVERFGNNLLLEKLAAGGMAEVYLAKSIGIEGVTKFLAVKRILPQFSENAEFINMFREEAKICVNLQNQNVVQIFDFGIEKKQFYLSMELVEGQNLRQILNHIKANKKKLTLPEIIHIVKEVASGLDHAHRCIEKSTGRPLNIIHRDMSPQNIMISFDGEVKIIDFGIAKAESQTEHTRVGTIKGKFGYMSPEQAEGHVVDARTDLFSLGIVLWELLADERLFVANNEAAILKKIRDCNIPSLRRLNETVPPELERICFKALSKNVDERYATAAAFHKDLNHFMNLQYPEFSTVELRQHMMEFYGDLYNEFLNKRKAYAQIQPPPENPAPRAPAPPSNQAQSMPLPPQNNAKSTMTGLAPDVDYNNDRLEIDTDVSKKIKLEDLKTKIDVMSPQKNTVVRRPPTPTSGSYNQTGTSTRANRKPATSNSLLYSMIGAAFIFAGSIVVFSVFSSKKQEGRFEETTPALNEADNAVLTPNQQAQAAQNAAAAATEPDPATLSGPTENAELSSVQPQPIEPEIPKKIFYTVSITSSPSGARVYVDGTDTGNRTPTTIQIEGKKEVKFGLQADGYQYYERAETILQNGSNVRATLQKNAQIGYVSINVFNGGSEPVIYINGQRLSEKPPIRFYAVPAGQAIKIKAVNPFAQLEAETTVNVGANQKSQVDLNLK